MNERRENDSETLQLGGVFVTHVPLSLRVQNASVKSTQYTYQRSWSRERRERILSVDFCDESFPFASFNPSHRRLQVSLQFIPIVIYPVSFLFFHSFHRSSCFSLSSLLILMSCSSLIFPLIPTFCFSLISQLILTSCFSLVSPFMVTSCFSLIFPLI